MVALKAGVWCNGVGVRSGWHGVNVLPIGEMASMICDV